MLKVASEEQKSFQDLKKKSLNSIGTLICRQFATKLIYLVANIVLARMLAPQVFGIFAIVSFVVQFFSVFGDVGIGAALIQKKDELSRDELSSIFWLQQLLVWIVAAIAIAAAPLALKFYPTLPPVGIWLIRAMALGFVLSSLKTVPAILMERNIEFNRIAMIDIAESLSFHGAAVVFAFAGYEVWSFVWAAIIRSFLGVVVVYSISSWRPVLSFSFQSIRGLLRFGLPYQGNNILAFIKDAVTPVFIGIYAGAAAVGYVNWAKNFAFAPMMLSEIFGRVAFPAFSRIQSDKKLLTSTVERSIRIMTLVMFPVVAIMVAFGAEITHYLFTDKWAPGLNAYYFYCVAPLAVGIFMPLYSAILSLGKSNILLVMSALILCVEWGCGVPFVIAYGFTGISYTQPIHIAIFTYVYWHVLKSHGVRVSILVNVRVQLLAALFIGFALTLIKKNIDMNLFGLVGEIVAGLTLYVLMIFLLNKIIFIELIEYARLVVASKDSR